MGRRVTRSEERRARLATTLDPLPATYWSQMRRVRVRGRTGMLVDHVLLGPSGIYVICDLTGGCDGPGATARGAGSRVVDLAAEACAEHAELLGDVLAPRYRHRVRPILCVDDAEERSEVTGGVLVASCETLAHVLRSSPPVLSTSEVAHASSRLEACLEVVPLAPETARRGPRFALRRAAASFATPATRASPRVRTKDRPLTRVS